MKYWYEVRSKNYELRSTTLEAVPKSPLEVRTRDKRLSEKTELSVENVTFLFHPPDLGLHEIIAEQNSKYQLYNCR